MTSMSNNHYTNIFHDETLMNEESSDTNEYLHGLIVLATISIDD